MDGKQFDACLRMFANSRRSLVGAGLISVLGVSAFEDLEARKKKRKKKKCKGGKVKCGKTCCSAGDVCQDAAAGSCCPQARACGSVCCGATQVCANPETATCVVGTGTCAAGTGSCGTGGNFVFCDGNANCVCALATNGIVRCGTPIPDITVADCGLCSSDADCAIRFPDVVGAFCAANASAPCSCPTGQNLCVAPCPV